MVLVPSSKEQVNRTKVGVGPKCSSNDIEFGPFIQVRSALASNARTIFLDRELFFVNAAKANNNSALTETGRLAKCLNLED